MISFNTHGTTVKIPFILLLVKELRISKNPLVHVASACQSKVGYFLFRRRLWHQNGPFPYSTSCIKYE